MSFFRIIWRKITKFYYSNLPLEKVFFNKYYNPKYTWCRSDKGPSCVGSDNYTTKILRSKLPIFIKKYKIKSILDAGCGDFYWMKNINLIKINYYGLDIVSKLIEKNKKLYSKKNITFFKSNLVKDKLPKVDLIICRDVLTRSSQKNNILILKNFVKSKSKYLLTTFYPHTKENINIISGGFQKINLLLKPYNFKKPFLSFKEKGKWQKYMGLWHIAKINKK